jgi:hypothetical protein
MQVARMERSAIRAGNKPRIASGLQERHLVRARTQQAIRIIAGVTLASAVFGASVSSFTPDGAGPGVFSGAGGAVRSNIGRWVLYFCYAL